MYIYREKRRSRGLWKLDQTRSLSYLSNQHMGQPAIRGLGPIVYTRIYIYILSPSRNHSVDAANVETGPKLREDKGGQAFGEDVSELGCRRDVKNADSTKSHSFSNKVKINLNVLGTLMLNRVGRHVNGADVITINQCGMA